VFEGLPESFVEFRIWIFDDLRHEQLYEPEISADVMRGNLEKLYVIYRAHEHCHDIEAGNIVDRKLLREIFVSMLEVVVRLPVVSEELFVVLVANVKLPVKFEIGTLVLGGIDQKLIR
jgi:hypothetical protein